MPTLTYPLPEKNLLFVRCFGHLKPDDVIGWQVEDQIGQSGDAGFVTLVDLSELTGTDMTFDDLNAIYGKLVRHYAPRKQKLTLALYAPDDLAFGMTRIMQSLASMTEHIEVRVFRQKTNLAEHLPNVGQSFCDIRSLALGRNNTPRQVEA